MSLTRSLLDAVKASDECLVEALIQRGASENCVDECGYTPLHWTAIYDKPKISHALMKNGNCDLNCRDQDGYTPLHLAIKHGHKTVVQLLLNYGADVQERTRGNRTAEELAMAHDQWDIVQLLQTHRQLKRCTSRELPRRWELGRLLGCGGYGRVYLGYDLDDGRELAIKQVETASQRPLEIKKQLQELNNEINVLRNLQQKNIVKYYGMERQKSSMFIFMEFMPGGSVRDLLVKFGPLSEDRVQTYSKQILDGVAYLHTNMVIHRDVKAANILLDYRQVNVKLGDFGLSKKLERCSIMTAGLQSVLGSPYWMAPEVVKATPYQGYGRRADIWSFGCTIIEMCTTRPPWSDMEPMTAIYNIGTGERSPVFPAEICNALKDLLFQCFNRDPKSRPTAQELLNHPFINPKRASSVSAEEDRNISSLKSSTDSTDDENFSKIERLRNIYVGIEELIYLLLIPLILFCNLICDILKRIVTFWNQK